MPNHSYTVELRFYGNKLLPLEISKRLNLQPSISSDSCNVKSKLTSRRPFWGYNGEGENGFQSEWRSLEDGFIFLFQKLNPLKQIVIDLSSNFEGIWWCGHFQSSFDGGPVLSAQILGEVASYGLPVFIDNYFYNESD